MKLGLRLGATLVFTLKVRSTEEILTRLTPLISWKSADNKSGNIIQQKAWETNQTHGKHVVCNLFLLKSITKKWGEGGIPPLKPIKRVSFSGQNVCTNIFLPENMTYHKSHFFVRFIQLCHLFCNLQGTRFEFLKDCTTKGESHSSHKLNQPFF